MFTYLFEDKSPACKRRARIVLIKPWDLISAFILVNRVVKEESCYMNNNMKESTLEVGTVQIY